MMVWKDIVAGCFLEFGSRGDGGGLVEGVLENCGGSEVREGRRKKKNEEEYRCCKGRERSLRNAHSESLTTPCWFVWPCRTKLYAFEY